MDYRDQSPFYLRLKLLRGKGLVLFPREQCAPARPREAGDLDQTAFRVYFDHSGFSGNGHARDVEGGEDFHGGRAYAGRRVVVVPKHHDDTGSAVTGRLSDPAREFYFFRGKRVLPVEHIARDEYEIDGFPGGGLQHVIETF